MQKWVTIMMNLYFTLKVIGMIAFAVACVVAIIYVLAKNWDIFHIIRDIDKPESIFEKRHGDSKKASKKDCE